MQDMLATCCLVYSAEKFVRVPDTINVYRVVDSSLTHKARAPLKQLQKYSSALIVGFNHLDKFLSGREFFKQHPEMKRLALETYVHEISVYLDIGNSSAHGSAGKNRTTRQSVHFQAGKIFDETFG